MFRTMLSPADRRKLAEEYVAQRALLKSRFLTERLEKQDATAAYKKEIAPLLEPTITTTEQIAKLADTTTKLAQEAQKQSEALEILPEDLAAVLPLDQLAYRWSITANLEQRHRCSGRRRARPSPRTLSGSPTPVSPRTGKR